MRDKWKTLVHPSWHEPLEPVSDHISSMGDFLRSEISQGHHYVPPGQQIFRAFADPFDQVRVLIVGQDPYPTPGHAMGLSFSVTESTQPLPKSLINIFTEYCTDLGYPQPRSGNLQPWSAQGVLLLNRVLTTRAGSPGAHQGKGWEKVTEQAITALVARGNSQPLVSILWGRQAATLKPLLAHGHVIESAHPSPLSAHRGFFGSRPFSRTNAFLQQCGMPHLDWRLP